MIPAVLPHDDTGDGPAVVLLHAGIADRRMWHEHVAPLTEAGLRVITLDLPGFGEAPMPEGPLAPWVDVLETMDALAIERALLAGDSLGAGIALRVAVVAPERVSAQLLVSPPVGLEPGPDLRAAWDAEESALERGDVEAAVEAVVAAWTLPEAPEELRELVAVMQRRAFAVQGDTVPEEAPDPLDAEPSPLPDLDVPTVVAVGDRDFPEFRAAGERLARELPRARYVVVEDAGHLAPLETPEEFRALLLELAGS